MQFPLYLSLSDLQMQIQMRILLLILQIVLYDTLFELSDKVLGIHLRDVRKRRWMVRFIAEIEAAYS